MKWWNSAFNAQGSRVIIVVLHSVLLLLNFAKNAKKKLKLKEYSVADSLFPRFRSLAAASSRQIKVGIPKKILLLLPFSSKSFLGC